MFIISLHYIKPLKDVDPHIQAHIDYLKKYYALNKFIVSGRKVPRTGGIILANCADLPEVSAIIAEDPFCIAKVAEYQITEFVPTMTATGFEHCKDYR